MTSATRRGATTGQVATTGRGSAAGAAEPDGSGHGRGPAEGKTGGLPPGLTADRPGRTMDRTASPVMPGPATVAPRGQYRWAAASPTGLGSLPASRWSRGLPEILAILPAEHGRVRLLAGQQYLGASRRRPAGRCHRRRAARAVPGSTRSPLTKVPLVECSSRMLAWPASSTVTVACRLDTFSYRRTRQRPGTLPGRGRAAGMCRLGPRRCRSGKTAAARRGRSVPPLVRPEVFLHDGHRRGRVVLPGAARGRLAPQVKQIRSRA